MSGASRRQEPRARIKISREEVFLLIGALSVSVESAVETGHPDRAGELKMLALQRRLWRLMETELS